MSQSQNRHACLFPGCGKTFYRKDHLKRHSVNHNENASSHPCTYPNCNMTFKRTDVRNNHYQRHFNQKRNKIAKSNYESPLPYSSPIENNALTESGDKALSDVIFNSALTGKPDTGSKEEPPAWLGWLFTDGISNNLPNYDEVPPFDSFDKIYPLSSLSLNGSPNSLLFELFQSEFGDSILTPTTSISVTPELIRRFLYLIPSLVQHPDFSANKLEYCLQVYWAVFHIQYPILHKPSFNTLTELPLLVLAMIAMGATFSVCENNVLEDPHGIAMAIAKPLRWLIFSHRISGPLELSALQSLLILEVFEKHYGSRELHERSSVHQAAKIEMMKRSPILGGDPYASESRANPCSPDELKAVPANQTELLWKKWIHAESLKRCALMGFCFDLTNFIVSSHNASLFVNKLRLELPCDDLLWESDFESLKTGPLPQKSEPVLLSLRRLLIGEKVEASSFGKRVLLNALFSIIVQFEQRDETSSLTNREFSHNIAGEPWREKVSYALDAWRYLVDDGVCCDVDNLAIDMRARKSDLFSEYLRLNDTKCKYPSYHMAHIRLYIVNFDMLIYAGAPLRMNVKTKFEDYENVRKRIEQWALSVNGKICVIHAYLCIYECLVDEGKGQISYEPQKDPIPERPHIIIYCSLIIWCYNYITRGPEVQTPDSPPSEEAFAYLSRVKSELNRYLVEGESALAYYRSVRACAMNLTKIPNLQNLAGYTETIAGLYSECSWVLGQEYSRLMLHCRDRSMGYKKLFCDNMYREP
ncbi:unnamed protein product [Kuraishia capsulata CBS 1993]|uniref:C2H2-type domain-containing protein n=1 Tax=Kuraishia capsulata CBS 1993 TaxID=1382522 RepID=W6MF09_9ASCO|nr:uncharacterized protein KUCA_T00000029001 [Kuraishia capsulata CBS 1993]CDK24069.1 unnamed protein product [Kuraishia capsulata CBS 1993]